MAVLSCFLLALGVFMKTFLCRGVMGKPCIVRISANPFVKMVQATPVACFIGAQNLEELREELDDSTHEIELANTDEVKIVHQCALLAHAKGYKLFALGMNRKCLSSADIQHKYYINGTNQTNCKEGYGIGDSMFVYSLEPLPVLQPLGCFNDSQDRALPENYANFHSQINDKSITVYQCAWVAHHKGYKYFAVQNYGECWTGNAVTGSHDYATYGNSSNCLKIDKPPGFGVGTAMAYFVYRIK